MPASPDDFKAALGRFASGVTVVTLGGEEDHGMTASASLLALTRSAPRAGVCQEWQRDARQVARGRGLRRQHSRRRPEGPLEPLRGLGVSERSRTSGQTSTSHAAP